MTAITPTEISVEDVVTNVEYGTGKRRVMVFVRGASGVDHTLNLQTYVPEIADVEGYMYGTDDGAVMATAPTWSTVTVTTKVAATAAEMCFMCTLT